MNIILARRYLEALRDNPFAFEEYPEDFPETEQLANGLLRALDLLQETNSEAEIHLGWREH